MSDQATTTAAPPVIDRKKHPDGVHRDHNGWPIYPVGGTETTRCKLCGQDVAGKPHMRVTKFIKVLEDNYKLERWQERQVLKGLVIKEHLLLEASNAINPDDESAERDALDKIVEKAKDAAGSHDKASRGSAVHELIEKRLTGRKIRVPAAVKPDLAAYDAKMTEHGLVLAETEINIVIPGVKPSARAYGLGGRFDMLYQLPAPCPNCGQLLRIGDLKTGRVDFGQGAMEMQLAAYAMGKRINPATGEINDIAVCQCYGYIIHLPAGEGVCHLYRADLARGRADLAVAYDVWMRRSIKERLELLEQPDAPDGQAADGETSMTAEKLMDLIKVQANRPSMEGLWRQYAAQGLWTEEHTLAAKQRLAELEGANQ